MLEPRRRRRTVGGRLARAAVAHRPLPLPLANAFSGVLTSETFIGLGAVVFINVCAWFGLALANSPRTYPWLPYATTTYDVTTTTGVFSAARAGRPGLGVKQSPIGCFYLISIAMTALRNDGRLTLYAGALAIVEYGLGVDRHRRPPATDLLARLRHGFGGAVERPVLRSG